MKTIDRIRLHRGFIRLLSLNALSKALAEPCADPALRARVTSELTVRAWLYAGGGEWNRLPERGVVESGWGLFGLPTSVQQSLSRWLCGQASCRSYEVPAITETDALFVDFLRRDIGDFENAHGIIPFVFRVEHADIDPVVLLPFILRLSTAGNVTTADGMNLPQLHEGVARARQGLTACGLLKADELFSVILTSLHDPGIPLTGGSLGLPVMAAWYFRKKGVEPRALAVGFSGCLDHHGHLDIDTCNGNNIEAKAERMARCGFPIRVFPSDDGTAFATVCWPVAQPLDKRLEGLCREILLLPLEHRRSVEDPGARLDAIAKGIRFGGILAQRALDDLAQIEKDLESRVDCLAQHHLLTLKGLQASALCHLGRADDSARVTGELIGLRHEVGAEYIAEALVRQSVNLTDFADYRQAVVCAEDAFQLARHLRLNERKDMELKALSTKAQALVNWALIDASKVAEAGELSLRAVEIAREVDSVSASGEKSIPRNLVYVFLWYALHDPRGAIEYGAEIRDQVAVDLKSWSYYLRARWLAAYRGLIMGVPISWCDFAEEMPGERDEGGWLFTLCCKYRGALRASTGDLKGAEADFRAAMLFADGPERAPLLKFLSATAGVQAVESLGIADKSLAAWFGSKSAPIICLMSNWYVEPKISATVWEARLSGLLDGRNPADLPNPQMFYPY